MPLFGAHLSVAGGFERALLEAHRRGFDTVQIFTKAPSQWKGRNISDEEAQLFRRTLKSTGIKHPTGHDSYLINLATADDTLFRRSVEAFVDELQRAELLGLKYLVMHPGAHLGMGEADGLQTVIRAFDEIHERCPDLKVQTLVETTAGQGTTLGYRFEHLREILSGVHHQKRMGVCFDTCHVLAAGYSLSPETEYRKTMREFDRLVGLKRIKVFHLNDSMKPQGSRVDRHQGIGDGYVGIEAFRLLVNDPQFAKFPMILETPKESEESDDMDSINLSRLQGLVRG